MIYSNEFKYYLTFKYKKIFFFIILNKYNIQNQELL